jgi:hypothetical protein
MRPVEFGEALAARTRLTLFSDDKPDRLFTVIKFWMDETSGIALALRTEGGRLLSERKEILSSGEHQGWQGAGVYCYC